MALLKKSSLMYFIPHFILLSRKRIKWGGMERNLFLCACGCGPGVSHPAPNAPRPPPPPPGIELRACFSSRPLAASTTTKGKGRKESPSRAASFSSPFRKGAFLSLSPLSLRSSAQENRGSDRRRRRRRLSPRLLCAAVCLLEGGGEDEALRRSSLMLLFPLSFFRRFCCDVGRGEGRGQKNNDERKGNTAASSSSSPFLPFR